VTETVFVLNTLYYSSFHFYYLINIFLIYIHCCFPYGYKSLITHIKCNKLHNQYLILSLSLFYVVVPAINGKKMDTIFKIESLAACSVSG